MGNRGGYPATWLRSWYVDNIDLVGRLAGGLIVVAVIGSVVVLASWLNIGGVPQQFVNDCAAALGRVERLGANYLPDHHLGDACLTSDGRIVFTYYRWLQDNR